MGMMMVIKDQRELLTGIKYEVDTARERLEKTMRATEEVEMKRKYAEKKRLLTEKYTRRVTNEKENLENEISKLENQKIIIAKSLHRLEQDKILAREQINKNEVENIRLRSGLGPLLVSVSESDSLLA